MQPLPGTLRKNGKSRPPAAAPIATAAPAPAVPVPNPVVVTAPAPVPVTAPTPPAATAAVVDTVVLSGLSKRYGESVVFKDVSLRVRPGEFVAIVGESGVGKSTLLNCMAGLDTWDSGTVAVNGQDMGSLDSTGRALLRRAQVGFVFQAFHVLPHLDVAQNIALPLMLLQDAQAIQAEVDARVLHETGALNAARLGAVVSVDTPGGSGLKRLVHGIRQALSRDNPSRWSQDTRVLAMLSAVGLEGLGSRLPQQLSGGQLQRVAIARALVHRPALVLADEPTGNLDPDTAARVMDVLCTQAREHGTSVVLVTHSQASAARADRRCRLRVDGIEA